MTTLYLYDEFGPEWWGLISAKSVVSELANIPDAEDLTVRVNSPGGDVNEAAAIYNALNRRSGHVTIEIDALAASAASYVAMAGDTINIAANARVMIHNPWTIALGDAAELRAVADVTETFQDQIADVYAARTGLPREDLLNMMADETWMTADEAQDQGFADAVTQPLSVAARIRPGSYEKAPDELFTGAEKFVRQRSLHSAEMVDRQINLTRRRAGV